MAFVAAGSTIMQVLEMVLAKSGMQLGMTAESLFMSAVTGLNSSTPSHSVPQQTAPELVDDATASTPSGGLFAGRMQTGSIRPPPTPSSGGSISSNRANIVASQFPSSSELMSHPYLQGPRDVMNIADFSEEQFAQSHVRFRNILDQEYRIIARYFGLIPSQVENTDVLAALAVPAFYGDFEQLFTEQNLGHIVTPAVIEAVNGLRARAGGAPQYARDILARTPFLGSVLAEAKADFEMERGHPVSDSQFADAIVQSGTRVTSIQRAAERLVSRFGFDSPATRAALRKYVLRRLLPAAASAAATFALKQTWNAITGAPLDSRNEEFDMRRVDIGRELDDYELDYDIGEVLRDMGIGDGAVPHKDYSDSLLPIEGSVLFTPDPNRHYGVRDSCMPTPVPPYPAMPSLKRPPPSGDVFNYALQGTNLSERSDDIRARRTRTRLDQPLPLPSPSPEIPLVQARASLPQAPASTNTPPPPVPSAGLTSSGANFRQNPALQMIQRVKGYEQQLSEDHAVTQNYDPTMTTSMPANVSAPTSTFAEDYTGENRAYRQFLDDAPNVVGIGYDEYSTERDVMERLVTSEAGVPRQQFGKRAIETDKTEVDDDSAALDQPDRPPGGVSVADTRNPLFANAGRSVPTTRQVREVAPVRALNTSNTEE